MGRIGNFEFVKDAAEKFSLDHLNHVTIASSIWSPKEQDQWKECADNSIISLSLCQAESTVSTHPRVNPHTQEKLGSMKCAAMPAATASATHGSTVSLATTPLS